MFPLNRRGPWVVITTAGPEKHFGSRGFELPDHLQMLGNEFGPWVVRLAVGPGAGRDPSRWLIRPFLDHPIELCFRELDFSIKGPDFCRVERLKLLGLEMPRIETSRWGAPTSSAVEPAARISGRDNPAAWRPRAGLSSAYSPPSRLWVCRSNRCVLHRHPWGFP